jgi:hypothetical protein
MVLIGSNLKMRVAASGMMCHTQFWGDSTTEIQPRMNTDLPRSSVVKMNRPGCAGSPSGDGLESLQSNPW